MSKQQNLWEIVSDLTSCFDGDRVFYGDKHAIIKLLNQVNHGAERDAASFSRDMYLAIRHENEQKEKERYNG